MNNGSVNNHLSGPKNLTTTEKQQQQQQQPFNGLFSRTTWVSRYQKGKTNLDFTGATESEWQ